MSYVLLFIFVLGSFLWLTRMNFLFKGEHRDRRNK